ncbi:hypothetical protein BJF78_15350 [Pseudonocardia sp. CNS-139]|nr:hypothetical protein BJF78_15350 [Pseudonocardia sp. CNS-139]
MVWQAAGAVLLLAMAAIHLYLVIAGTGGVLGLLFVLNAIGGLVLAIAVVAAPRRLQPLASVLGLLFMAGTLLALVLALTTGLFGIREVIDGLLVVPTLVVESIGVLVLIGTTLATTRAQRAA